MLRNSGTEIRLLTKTISLLLFLSPEKQQIHFSAIKLAKERGATIFGICNVVGSSIAREAHAGAYTHAGPEIGVASTKAFTAQVAILSLIAIELGNIRGKISTENYRKLLYELEAIPEKIEKTLAVNDQAIVISEQFKDASNFLYLVEDIVILLL